MVVEQMLMRGDLRPDSHQDPPVLAHRTGMLLLLLLTLRPPPPFLPK